LNYRYQPNILINILLPAKGLFLSIFIIAGISLGSAVAASDTGNGKQPVRVYETKRLESAPPHIDGVLNDKCWKEGEWAGDFLQRKPRGGDKASLNTFFKILYDDKYLYVAFRCDDPEPEKIMRLVGKHDELKGDAVGIAFDSYFDKRTGFEFDVTAAGGKIDMSVINDGKSFNFNWDAVWYARTAISESGWTAEIMIPFSQLRFSNRQVQTWGLHVTRRIYRFNEEDNWQWVPLDAPGMVHLFGELRGIEGISPSARIELLPYTVGSVRLSKPQAGNPYRTGTEEKLNAGFDAKVGLGSNFTLDLSVNPDFGQVEADPALLNLTVFEPSFEEKRPFFIEGSNMLQFSTGASSLFYSRRIGSSPKYRPTLKPGEYSKIPDRTSILSAAKVTGKTTNGLSVGILQCVTASEYASISDSIGEVRHKKVEPLTSYAVGQVSKEINQGNAVLGGILTSTNRFMNGAPLDFLNKNAWTGGVDFLQQFHEKTYYVKLSAAGSYINGDSIAMLREQTSSARYYQRPDNKHNSIDSSLTSMVGSAGELIFGKQGNGRFTYYERLRWVTPGYESNDLGFLNQSDILEQKTAVSYKEQYASKFYSDYTFFSEHGDQWDFSGNMINSWTELYASLTFKNFQKISGGVVYLYNQNDARILRGGPMLKLPSYFNLYGDISSDERKVLSTRFHYGHFIYRDGISRSSIYTLNVNWKAGSAVNLGTSFTYRPLINDYQYVSASSGKYILGKLDQQTAYFTVRVGIYLTPEISIQYYGNPYFSTGSYSGFKKVTAPDAKNYKDRFQYFSQDNILLQNNEYTVSDISDGSEINFRNPDFIYHEFHSNLVFRWEFRPSSNLYLVWTHGRTSYVNHSGGSLSDASRGFFDIFPENVLLVKFVYWFSL
jgi:hypothetical protein